MIEKKEENGGRDVEEEKQHPRPTAYCYGIALMACLNSCNLGYDVGSVGGAAMLMRDDLAWNDWQQSLFVSSINFFSILGALNAGYVCDALGRRRTFTVSCAIFIVGIVAQISSRSFLTAMIGRVFVGIGVGLGLAIDPMYIAEVVPPWNRGHLVSFSEISINFGIMLGMFADYAFLSLPEGVNWRVMLGLGIVMPTLLIILTFTVMPESPRWLLLNGRRQEAQEVLQKTYPKGTDLEEVVNDIHKHIQADVEADKKSSWKSVLCPSPVVLRMLLAGVGLAACQQISGSESFVYFSPKLFEMSGFTSRQEAFGMSVLIGASKMVFTLVAVFYSDNCGRRPLLLSSNTGLFIFLLLMGLVSPHPKLAPVMVFAMCAYMACFSIALGPLTWVGAAEVFPTYLRAKAMSLATSVNRLISGTVAATTLPATKALGQQNYFFLYAAFTFCAGVYLYFLFPETKGRSLEGNEDFFERMAEADTEKQHSAGNGPGGVVREKSQEMCDLSSPTRGWKSEERWEDIELKDGDHDEEEGAVTSVRNHGMARHQQQ